MQIYKAFAVMKILARVTVYFYKEPKRTLR